MKHERLAVAQADLVLVRDWLRAQDPGRLFQVLHADMDWRHEELSLYGRTVRVPRLIAWYADPGCVYRYSGVDHQPLPWLSELEDIRQRVAMEAGGRFNGVLGNLYRSGSDYMGWHSDDEASLGDAPTLASVSLGATRRMRFRHRRRQHDGFGIDLHAGDLLIMSGDTQRHWQHCLTRTARPVGARINLTFRLICSA